MFARGSRYYGLPDVLAPDAHGRLRAGKALRRLPLPPARLVHTIDAGDRLDQLAYKYYRRSRQWWHVADANPEPLSPLALLGDGGERTLELELGFVGPQPPWQALLRGLRGTLGVSRVVQPAAGPMRTLAELGLLFELAPALAATLNGAVLAQQLSVALDTALAGAGRALSDSVRVSQLGPASYLLQDLVSGQALRLQSGAAALQVFDLQPMERWYWQVSYNALSVEELALRGLAESHGFTIGEARALGRVGKPLLVPARPG